MTTAAGRSGDADRRTAWVLPAAVWAVGAAIFFRTPIFSGFDTITGDEGDVRLVVFLHEHWWKVLQGDAGWRDPPAFFPADDVLSYSDTFVLNAVVYVPLRLVGIDQFVAVQLCLIALTAVGFASVYLLLRRHVAISSLAAALLAATVAFANNLYIDTAHAQLFSVAIVPLIVLLGVEAWRAESDRSALRWSAAAGVVLGSLLWSNFYFGWFAVVAGVIGGAVAGALLMATGARGEVIVALRDRWRRIVAAAGGLAVMLVPFFLTYWPALKDDRSRSYDEVAGLAPRPFDMINAGRDNVTWGWLMRALTGDDARLEQLNRAVALTPLLLVAALTAGVMLAVEWCRHGRSPRVVVGVTASVTALVLVVLPVQFGFGGAWSWLHRFVPGGAAIRVYARIEVVNVFVAVLAVASCLPTTAHRTRDDVAQYLRNIITRSVGLGVVVAGLIAVEQVNLTDNFRRLDRGQQVAMLDDVPEIPERCTAFAVLAPPGRNPDHASIDAMLIAQRVGVPTVNGYSGWMPEGWNLQPGSDSYEADLAAWLARHGLTDTTCVYDIAAGMWR